MNVGLLGPGAMGSAVASTLRGHGATVRTCLERPSPRTRTLAERDRLEAAPTLADLALATELLVAAQSSASATRSRRSSPIAGQHRAIRVRQILRTPPVAHRWIGEMEEIAKTFAELALMPRILEGPADLYRFAASAPSGAERPETRDVRRGLDATLDALARAAEEPARTR